VGTCPNGTVVSDQKCLGCDPNCHTCSASDTSACVKCNDGFVLFNNTCFTTCPDGYQVDDEGIECEIIPTVTVIEEEDKVWFYFPVLTTQILLSLVALASYWKDKSSLILSNMVALYGPLEFVAYGA